MKMFIGLWPKHPRDKTHIKHSRFCKMSIPSSILEQRYTFTKASLCLYKLALTFLLVCFQDGEIIYTDWAQGKDECEQGENHSILDCCTFIKW